jgi:mono/diheme cytochrome c family protein
MTARKLSSLAATLIAGIGFAACAAAAPNGQKVYEDNCLACHMADGMGVPRMQPPLVGSQWVGGDPQALAAFVITGGFDSANRLDGRGENTMPMFGQLDDETLAAVLTYIRDEFGDHAGPVTAEDVKAARQAAGN